MVGVRVSAASRRNAIVVTAAGRLDVRTYPELRDALLKHAADAEDALVVDVNALELPVSGPAGFGPALRGSAPPPLLSVFTAVWSRLSTWPGIPVHLVADREPLATALRTGAVSRFVPVHRTLADALDAVGVPPPRQRTELRVHAGTPGAHAARAWVADVVTSWNLTAAPPHRRTSSTDPIVAWFDSHSEDDIAREWLLEVVQVASELVENVLRHTGSDALLRLEVRPGQLSIAVSDDDPGPPGLLLAADSGLTGGRDLVVVEHLAHAWGHRERPSGGKAVWAVLTTGSGAR